MVIQPDSTITLYSGVDIGTDMQLAFSSATKQTAYFTSKVKKAYVNCTTVKDKIGVVRVAVKPVGQAGTGEITGHDLAACNYMSFINPSFDNKVIYCYVVDYKYLNNETAEIMYVIDYWQTWMFDVDFHDMYIDREHLSEDDWDKIEANPYDPTVPQMITEEPLPTPMGYEKPFYDIQWGIPYSYSPGEEPDPDCKDGQAMIHCNHPLQVNYNGMMQGDWDYWNVLLIMAPTDWTVFGESLEDEDRTYYVRGDVCEHGGDYYVCNVDQIVLTEWDPNDWTQITPGNPNHEVGSFTVSGHGYVFSATGNLYHNTVSSSQTFDSMMPQMNLKFERVTVGSYNPTGVQGTFEELLEKYNIARTEAGSQFIVMRDGATERTAFSWSTKPRGCEGLLIRSSEAWKELATFFTKYNAVSQIIGIFGVPVLATELAAIGSATDGTPYMTTGMGTEDNVTLSVSSARTELEDSGVQVEVKNKKLLTHPYSYLRVISPDGNIKEYDYGKFSDVADGDTTDINFKIICDVTDGQPKLYLIPYNYDHKNTVDSRVITQMNSNDTVFNHTLGSIFSSILGFNVDESMVVTDFPEISFNTDGYLTFLAGSYAQTTAQRNAALAATLSAEAYNTDEGMGIIGALSNVISGAVSGAKSGSGSGVIGAIGGGLAGAASGGLSSMNGLANKYINRQIYEETLKKYEDANSWASGGLINSSEAPNGFWSGCKPAYANSVYRGGTGGTIKYLRGMGLFDFVAIHVQLRPEILALYDKWFDLYGYKSTRCGIPYVIQFCRGGSDLPHWVESEDNINDTTYIKTYDCKVEHAMLPVAQNIKKMFDTGVRMKKGDLS